MALIDVTTAKSMDPGSNPIAETGRLHECIQLRYTSPDDVPANLKENAQFHHRYGYRSRTPIAEDSKIESIVFIDHPHSDHPETTMIFQKNVVGNKGAPVFTTQDYADITQFMRDQGVADSDILRPERLEMQMRATSGLSNHSSAHELDYFATEHSGIHNHSGYKEHTVPAGRYRDDAERVARRQSEETAGDTEAQARETAATLRARAIASRHGIGAQSSQIR